MKYANSVDTLNAHEDQMTEAKSINERVLAFGIATVLILVIVICGVLMLFLYNTSTKLTETHIKVAESNEVIYDLRRALDRAEGRLGVYEDFLIGTQVSSLKRMISKYLRRNQVKSDEVTLAQFETWANEANSLSMGAK